MVAERGEVILRFAKPTAWGLDFLTSFMSIDNYQHDTVTAYVNEAGLNRFLTLGIPYRLLQPPSLGKDFQTKRRQAVGDWRNRYPAYAEYIDLMEGFAADYPNICRIIQFGTSINGHKLLALKITDNPGIRENEPVVLLTSTIHGDEPLGFVLMLRLIDYLLENYGTRNQVNNLVNQVETWINPLANPDGAYFFSDTSLAGATRFNAQQEDLNRNFPDPQDPLWEGRLREPETMAMMNFMEDIHVVLAANFHGGAEVVNYPWDTWIRLHADDMWYRKISRAYADTAQSYGPAGYMTFLDNGITNGHAWYPVYGGRQDYTNFFRRAREVTIELSDVKIPPENNLEDYWNYNRQSLLQYISQSLTGITGIVSDSITGQALVAEVRIKNHDFDSSFVLSSSATGIYYRLLEEGKYLINLRARGYREKNLSVQVSQGALTRLDASLQPVVTSSLFPNPFINRLYLYIDEPGNDLTAEFFDLSGRKHLQIKQPVVSAGILEIKTDGIIGGIYVVKITYGNEVRRQVVVCRKF